MAELVPTAGMPNNAQAAPAHAPDAEQQQWQAYALPYRLQQQQMERMEQQVQEQQQRQHLTQWGRSSIMRREG